MCWQSTFLSILFFYAILSVHSYTASYSTGDNENDDNKIAEKLLIFTVATEETDGFRRFMQSAQKFGLETKVLGLGSEWKGGDVRLSKGGGQKIRLFKDAMEEYKDEENLLVLFSDAYDVIVNDGADEILRKFHEFYPTDRVLFSSEGFCWPDKELAVQYPLVKFGKRYLCSGLFMGYANEIYKILSVKDVQDSDDDQLYYTLIYLDEKLRKDLKITLDSMARIFQNLNGAEDDVELKFLPDGMPYAHNVAYNSRPAFIHGNGPTKQVYLHYLANYLGGAYNQKNGCVTCLHDKKELPSSELDYPVVTIAIFIAHPIPFLAEFFATFSKLDYPSSKIHLYLYCNQEHAEKAASELAAESAYASAKVEILNMELGERQAKDEAIEYCISNECDYLLYLDGEVHLTNADTLKLLIQQNRPILSPMVSRPGKLFSNFWGALSTGGYYARSDDYVELVRGERVGLWSVPFISAVYLIAKEKLTALKGAYSYNKAVDADMSFAQLARDNGHHLVVDNQHYYGFLVNSEEFEVDNRLFPELWAIFDNRELWEKRYINPGYYESIKPETELEQPCPDVYDFPFLSEQFCNELVMEMEHYGQWSNGKNEDNRLTGGYENVPTRDIHMRQIDFERQWMYMLDEFARPVQEKIFIGYYHKPIDANMMFVVRYRPDEQPSLRPHHDASTYSIDIALNTRDVDYEGGGVRFVRYNCTIAAEKKGWSMIFPGRLTHLHEGLPTTKGTRYIAVSFINP